MDAGRRVIGRESTETKELSEESEGTSERRVRGNTATHDSIVTGRIRDLDGEPRRFSDISSGMKAKDQILNPNLEIRNNTKTQMSNDQNVPPPTALSELAVSVILLFEFVSDFEL